MADKMKCIVDLSNEESLESLINYRKLVAREKEIDSEKAENVRRQQIYFDEAIKGTGVRDVKYYVEQIDGKWIDKNSETGEEIKCASEVDVIVRYLALEDR